MSETERKPSADLHEQDTSPDKSESTSDSYQEALKNSEVELVEQQEKSSDSIKQELEREAAPSPDIAAIEQPENEKHRIGITKDIKTKSYNETLRQVRHNLNKTEKTFSRIIHQPFVEKLSNISAKTVARPAGILGGGILAFAGGIFVLTVAKMQGFSYNFLLIIILYLSGYLLVTALEMAIRWGKNLRK